MQTIQPGHWPPTSPPQGGLLAKVFRHLGLPAMALLVIAGCSVDNSRSLLDPHPSVESVQNHVAIRLDTVEASGDHLLLVVQISNPTDQRVTIERDGKTYPRVTLLGAGAPLTAQRESTKRTVQNRTFEILPREQAHLAISFTADQLGQRQGLKLHIEGSVGGDPTVWEMAIPQAVPAENRLMP